MMLSIGSSIKCNIFILVKKQSSAPIHFLIHVYEYVKNILSEPIENLCNDQYMTNKPQKHKVWNYSFISLLWSIIDLYHCM